MLSYNKQTETITLSDRYIDFEKSVLKTDGEFIFGKDKESGIYVSPQTLLVKNKEVYHTGNANLETVDWMMKDGNLSGDLSVKGKTVLSGILKACYGIELGNNGKVLVSTDNEKVNFSSNLSFGTGYGIMIRNLSVLFGINERDVQLGATGGELFLGNDNTNKIRLLANISDNDGDYVLLSKYGAAYFPDSLTVRHKYGDELFSSYRVDNLDEGMILVF